MTSLISPDAIDSFFKNLQGALPVYVPAMPSIILGLTVTVVTIIVGTIIALLDKNGTKDAGEFITKTRWLLIIFIAVLIGGFVGDWMKDRDYLIRCISSNKQHYANVHWLRLYMQSFHGNAT